MNKQPFEHSAMPEEPLETRLRNVARSFPYPATPDVAASVRQQLAEPVHPVQSRRRLVWVVVALLVVIVCVLLTAPEVRAAVVNLLRIGGVIIVPEAPTVSPTSQLPTLKPEQSVTATDTPRPSATAIQSLLDLAGETTLADAQRQVNFPIRLPTYPSGLPAPDRVYLQNLNGSVVVLVWLDPARPDGIRFALHILGPGAFLYKMQPKVIQETSVNGHLALWTEGPYFLAWQNGWDMRRIVNGDVLIWTDGTLTYRLESGLSPDEALKIAQSIPPVKP